MMLPGPNAFFTGNGADGAVMTVRTLRDKPQHAGLTGKNQENESGSEQIGKIRAERNRSGPLYVLKEDRDTRIQVLCK